MRKKIIAAVFVSVLFLSGGTSFAQIFDADDFTVPDSGSSVMLIGCAIAGLAGFRLFLRRKD